MIENDIVNKILSIEDTESGGDHALDGFEFQVSSAIYLIFDELESKREFQLAYEKLEDFIIFSNKVNLYQAKSTSKNLTPTILYTAKKSTKKDSSTLSIIEKMNNNYTSIKNVISDVEVTSTLIICKDQYFSEKLSSLPNIKVEESLSFKDFKDEIKNEIITKTKFKNYNWEDMFAIRIFPKTYHEELTRTHIEDVIENVLGVSKVSSLALYNALTCEIRRIRKNKTTISDKFLLNEIDKYSTIDSKIDFKDCNQLLNDEDKKNLAIISSFNFYQNAIKIHNHPNLEDYKNISELIQNIQLNTLDEYYINILSSSDFLEIKEKLKEYEIKALILLCLAKEYNL